mgnify:CR=1 FL=1
MIEDGSKYIGSAPLKTQVCSVGSGPAGITLAWYLLEKGIEVTILEGSRSFSPDGPNNPLPSEAYNYNENLNLYNGDSAGLFAQNEKQFLTNPTPQSLNNGYERERIYGGTSTHWGGQSRPLDAITFEERPGFPGWPITREDLDPYYDKACKFLNLYGDYYAPDGTPGHNFTAEFWANELGLQVADMDGFNVDMYQFIAEENLRFQIRKVNGKTIGESDARVILNASLLNIEEQNGSVNQLTVGVMSGTKEAPTKAGEFVINADVYVLACGAIANARQLLLSDVGNENNLVGKYLTGQPIANGASAVRTNSGYLTTKENELISYQNPNDAGTSKTFPISALRGLLTPKAEVMRVKQLGSCWFEAGGTSNFYHGLLPKYESQITLSDRLDPVFGQKQSKAVWVLSNDEERNFNELARLFEAAVKAKGGGDVTIGQWANVADKMVYNGHHLGTTRMSEKEEDGVVDKNLKVHSMDNLYVAGSSIWTSAGVSNPTFSIVAFSMRLADHLALQFKSDS